MTGTDHKGGAERRPFALKGRDLGMIAFGIVGVAILIALCVWQVQRLAWKEGVIATLEARLAAAPSPLPSNFEPEVQEFSRVILQGRFDGRIGGHGYVDAPLLTSRKFLGPGYRIIQPFVTTEGRVVMVDRGYAPVAEKNEGGVAAKVIAVPVDEIELVGVLRWPDEGGDGAAFGANDNVWTARDLDVMAELFGAEPVLIVSDTATNVDDWPEPQPLRAVNIRNNHMEYAITWASLALVWAIMTGYLTFRSVTRTS